MELKNGRVIKYDVLRIVAAFAVVFLHCSSQRFYDTFPSTEWEVRNIYDSFVRWCVPIFVMVSGALFLDAKKKLGLVVILTHTASHMKGLATAPFYDYLNIFTLCESVTVFLFVSKINIPACYYPVIVKISKVTLGIYLIHPLIMYIADNHFYVNTSTFNPIVFIPVFCIIIFVVSYVITSILMKVPYLNKFVQ